MPIAEQISRGLSDFTARYVMSKQDAIIHTSVEIRMNPALEKTIREQHDAAQWARFEADYDKNVPFSSPPPMPNLRPFTHIFGCAVTLDDTLPVNEVHYTFNGVEMSVQITD